MLAFRAFFHLKLLLHFFKLFFHLENWLRILAHFRPVKVLEHILIEILLSFLRIWLLIIGLCFRLFFLTLILLLLWLRLITLIFFVFFLRWLRNSSKLLYLCIDLILDLLNVISCEHRLFMMSYVLALIVYLLDLFFFLVNNLMDTLDSLFSNPFFSLNNLLYFLRVIIDLWPDSFIVKLSLWMMLLSVLIRSY